MDTLLQSLMHDWAQLYQLRDDMLKRMPEYPAIEQNYRRLDDEVERALGAEGKKLYSRYEDALGAYLSVCDRASLLCGAHAALRLLVTLL